MKKDQTQNHSSSKLEEELKIELGRLYAELQSAKTEAMKYKIIVDKNGLLEDVAKISDEEAICVEQIQFLKEQSSVRPFTETDAKILDILHKNLRMARGQEVKNNNSRKTKKMSTSELFKIVDGNH